MARAGHRPRPKGVSIDPRRRDPHDQARPAGQGAVLLREIVPTVRKEDGCIEYGPAVDVESRAGTSALFGPDTFVVIEKWESLKALETHSAAPHMAAYGERVKDLMSGRSIHVLEPA